MLLSTARCSSAWQQNSDMAEIATLARPYANAIFDIAKGARLLDRFSRLLAIMAAATEDRQLKTLLQSPEVSTEQKAFRLADVCGDEIDDRGRKFLQVLARNGRLPLIPEIQRQFEELKALEEKTLDVEVLSAFPLSDAEIVGLQTALQTKFEKQVTLTSSVDQHLLGGAIIRTGDMVIDGTVRGRLDKLAETLIRR